MWFLWSVAWRNLWRHRRRSLITAAAAATAVAMVMATMAFMDGMLTDLFEVMVEQKLGHVQVRHPDFPTRRQVWDTVTDRTDLLERIDAMPDTVASSPTLSSYGLLGGASESAGARIVGIDPARDQRVTPLHERVIEGRYLAEAPALEILLGWSLAEDIQVGVGDEVVAVTQASDGSVGNELYTVVGLYRTGDEAMDNAGGYLHLADAEDLFVLHDQAHGVTLLTDGPDAIEPFVAAVRAEVGGADLEVLPWWEASPQTAQLMAFRDTTAFMLLGIVFSVAAFVVVNTMLMSVFERTRELGLLMAIGLRPTSVVWLVVLESLFLAAIAAVLGLVLGGVLDWYLVVHGIDFSWAVPDGFSSQGMVLDPLIMGEVNADAVILTVLAVFVVAPLASLWPAIRAARLQPVDAMRMD